MRHGDLVVIEQACHERRAHALALRLRLSRLMNDFVGARHGVAQHDALAHEPCLRLDLISLFTFAGFAHEVDDCFYRDAARDFTGVVSAHAVGEHPQADVRLAPNAVFIVLSDFPDIRQCDMGKFAFKTHITRNLRGSASPYGQRRRATRRPSRPRTGTCSQGLLPARYRSTRQTAPGDPGEPWL